jgi:ribose 5-phosphate isomerase B
MDPDQPLTGPAQQLHQIGIAADNDGSELKEYLLGILRKAGHVVIDFSAASSNGNGTNPDFFVSLVRAVTDRVVDRGVGIFGSGRPASVTQHFAGVHASLIRENFPAHQVIEDDDLHLICFGGPVAGQALPQ